MEDIEALLGMLNRSNQEASAALAEREIKATRKHFSHRERALMSFMPPQLDSKKD